MPPDIKAALDAFLASADAVIAGLAESSDPYADAMRVLDELDSLNRQMAARRGVVLPEHRGAA